MLDNADCHNQANQIKPNDIIDFSNLQRGISVILADPTYTLDTKLETTNNLDAEKTYNLPDLVLQQQQQQQQQHSLPPVSSQLTQLEPVRLIPQQHQQTMILSLNECSMDSQSSASTSNSSKRKLEDETRTPSKRGRKPSSIVSSTTTVNDSKRNKFAKQQIFDEKEQKEKTLVYFGNKRVEVDTEEYQNRRKSNNEAVKKCRQKAEEEQKKREELMSKLKDENSNLKEKLGSMTKEMDVLKGIIMSMRPGQELPQNIQILLNEINNIK